MRQILGGFWCLMPCNRSCRAMFKEILYHPPFHGSTNTFFQNQDSMLMCHDGEDGQKKDCGIVSTQKSWKGIFVYSRRKRFRGLEGLRTWFAIFQRRKWSRQKKGLARKKSPFVK